MQGSKGGRRGISIFELLKTAILLALVAMVVMMGLRIRNFTGGLKSLVAREEPVENRDLTLENHGFLGYTASDLQGGQRRIRWISGSSRETISLLMRRR